MVMIQTSHDGPPLHVIRGRHVILDADLAALFGVRTKRLNEQLRRNPERFPELFAFRLSSEEVAVLSSQIATSNTGHGGRRYRPWAFSEHGVVMAANVLNSAKAVAVSVEIVKEFVRMRRALRRDRILAKRLAQLELAVRSRLDGHDSDIEELFKLVESLLDDSPDEAQSTKRIGFVP